MKKTLMPAVRAGKKRGGGAKPFITREKGKKKTGREKKKKTSSRERGNKNTCCAGGEEKGKGENTRVLVRKRKKRFSVRRRKSSNIQFPKGKIDQGEGGGHPRNSEKEKKNGNWVSQAEKGKRWKDNVTAVCVLVPRGGKKKNPLRPGKLSKVAMRSLISREKNRAPEGGKGRRLRGWGREKTKKKSNNTQKSQNSLSISTSRSRGGGGRPY